MSALPDVKYRNLQYPINDQSLVGQQGYTGQQEGYNNSPAYSTYSQTTQQPHQHFNPTVTSLSRLHDPRVLLGIWSVLVMAFYIVWFVQTQIPFALPAFLFHGFLILAGIRIICANGRHSQYITEYQLPEPVIRPPFSSSVSSFTQIMYLIGVVVGIVAVLLSILCCIIVNAWDITDEGYWTLFFGLAVVLNVIHTYFSLSSFSLERKSLKQWDRLYGVSAQPQQPQQPQQNAYQAQF